jgi:chromosomal replication initiation ATPase DnaA
MSVAPSQLPLDLTFRPALGRDDFLVGPCNAEAMAWIDRYPDWPTDSAVLCGAEASGKSHLLAVWAGASGAVSLDARTLRVADLDDRIGAATAVAIDAADAAIEPDSLFHAINMVRERRGHLLLAARQAPARWRIGTPDMRSRLAAMPLIELREPDDTVLIGVLMKHFDDRRVVPAPDVPGFLSARMPRTFAAAFALAAEMDRLSLTERRGITVPLARRALARIGADTQPETEEEET